MVQKLALGLAILCSVVEAAKHAKHASASSSHLRRSALHLSIHGREVRDDNDTTSFVRALDFKQTLRVCNAFPSTSDVFVMRDGDKATVFMDLAYKSCKDVTTDLNEGDKLQFQVGDETTGTFSVSELPGNDAMLLLVIYRHDALSSAVSFESHIFANLVNPQVAVLDTYRGGRKSPMHIKDLKAGNLSRKEDLRYDSVIAVNPGAYQVVLDGVDATNKTLDVAHQFVALNGVNYVILRCGLENVAGQFGESVIIFPESDPRALGAATRLLLSTPVVISMVLSMVIAGVM